MTLESKNDQNMTPEYPPFIHILFGLASHNPRIKKTLTGKSRGFDGFCSPTFWIGLILTGILTHERITTCHII